MNSCDKTKQPNKNNFLNKICFWKENNQTANANDKKSFFTKIKEAKLKKKASQYNEKYKDNYLTVLHLTKQYKKNMAPAIDDISFKVGPGEFHAFIGGNGAGKTTTIKSIIGAYAKYKGEIYFSGYSNKTLEAKRTLGYIPEIAKFPENTSTYSYLYNMALLSEIPSKQAKELTQKILVDLKMDKLAKKSPNSFSSGQKKKILLAQALLHNPKILIMDEPAANLDARARIEFFDTLKKLQAEGKSIFISSHILNEVDKYATHATILDGGKVVFSQSLADFRQNYNKHIELQVDKSDLCQLCLTQMNYQFKYNDVNQRFIITLNNNVSVDELMNKLKEYQINLIAFKTNSEISLEEIFYEYVIKGSVHTMQ